MAHLPPRTTGLLHIGETTILLPISNTDINNGYILKDMSSNETEDTLDRTFSFKEYHLDSMIWDLNLNEKKGCKIK